jgi:hypothetical protein
MQPDICVTQQNSNWKEQPDKVRPYDSESPCIHSVLNETKLQYFSFIMMQTESLSAPVVNF